MKNLIPIIVLGLFAVGCGNDSAATEKDLRDKLGQKEPDYNAIKPEDRARVLGLMKANGGAAKAAELEKQWGMTK